MELPLKLKRISEGGGGAEELLGAMRQHGCSKIESIKMLMKVLGLPLGEAKLVVHNSRVWQDRKEVDDEFQESLTKHLDDLGTGFR